MSERYPGWVNGMDAREARLATGTLVTSAAEGDPAAAAAQARSGVRPAAGQPGAVTAGEGLTVVVAPFQASIQDGRSSTGGTYLVTLDAPKTLTLDGAAQANARTDLVVAELTEPDDETPGGFRVRAIPGEPQADDPPELPATAIPLAEVVVPAGATRILPINITDERQWTCAVGGVLPLRGSGVQLANPFPGMYIHNLAAGRLEMYDGQRWQTFVPESDTGWTDVDVVAAHGWIPHISPPAAPARIRRIGRLVVLEGYVEVADPVGQPEPDTRVWGRVPATFWPASTHRWVASRNGSPYFALLRATVDGGLFAHTNVPDQVGQWLNVATSWLAADATTPF